MREETTSEVTPDSLLGKFHGRSVMPLVVFTVVVHAVVLLGSSVPFLWRTCYGPGELTEEQRAEKAVEDATAAIREIAEKYELSPQDISKSFGKRSPTAAAEAPPPIATPDNSGEPPEGPKSEIEKQLDVKADGPAVPSMDDDLF